MLRHSCLFSFIAEAVLSADAAAQGAKGPDRVVGGYLDHPNVTASPTVVVQCAYALELPGGPVATANQPAAPAMIPREPIDARGPRVVDFRFVDKSRDEVSASSHATPHGAPDEWFKLTLALAPQTEIQRIGIVGATAEGRSAEHYWTTQPGVNWIVGVEHAGVRANRGQVRPLGRFDGVVELDLFVADPRWFVANNGMLLEVVLTGGAKLGGFTLIGAAPQPAIAPPAAPRAAAPAPDAPSTPAAPVVVGEAQPLPGTISGRSATTGGTLPETKHRYLELTRTQPDSAEAWIGLGWARSYDGEIAHAISAYERAQLFAPNTLNLNTWLTERYIARSDWVMARRVIQREIATQPRSGWAASWLGTVEHETGDAVRAAATFKRASQLDPQVAGFRYQNGQRLIASQQPRRALSDVIAASLMAPNHAGTYYWMAECYVKLAMSEAAARYYEHYLRLDGAREWARGPAPNSCGCSGNSERRARA